ncbi:MAG: malate synthase A [Actinomycetota bacterium]|nr:malate synthase A [Actinomycetota bacterium]
MGNDEVTCSGPAVPRGDEVLTDEALAFVLDLHDRFAQRRDELLAVRQERRARIAREGLDFLDDTRDVREDPDWRVAPAPADLTDRRVEITGPTDRKMVVNALNSGARVFMADFEDSNSPTWPNLLGGQVNLSDAIARRIDFTSEQGKRYALGDTPATMVVRPRGWHLPERHVLVRGKPAVGALVDFGLYFFHNARTLLDAGSGPYFYLPKMESHLEARLWNDVFTHAQSALGIPHGSIRATVLIETLPAAFEMEEILYELRDHASGLNAGRWDYIFSAIKSFRDAGPEMVLPDRDKVTMTVPFMRAYTELLVATCHRRGAFAMGGMAAFIPNRRDPDVTARAFERVRADKSREASDGFDGTWVAHPDLVAIARECFDDVLGQRSNQLDRQRPDVSPDAAALTALGSTPGDVTDEGVRSNVSVALQYLQAWLSGSGAVGINNLMEDVATAEISRSQLWQWVRYGVKTAEGTVVTPEHVRAVMDEALAALRQSLGAGFESGAWDDARRLLEDLIRPDRFLDFLTLDAYELLP